MTPDEERALKEQARSAALASAVKTARSGTSAVYLCRSRDMALQAVKPVLWPMLGNDCDWFWRESDMSIEFPGAGREGARIFLVPESQLDLCRGMCAAAYVDPWCSPGIDPGLVGLEWQEAQERQIETPPSRTGPPPTDAEREAAQLQIDGILAEEERKADPFRGTPRDPDPAKNAENVRRGVAAFRAPVQVGGRSARFSTAQRQSRENQPTGPFDSVPDPLLEDIVNGRPFHIPGPSEFEIREEVDKRLAKLAAEVRSLAGAVDRLTDLVRAKLVAKPPSKKANPSATPSADAYLASLDYALKNSPEFAAKFKASQDRWARFAATKKTTAPVRKRKAVRKK